MSIRGISLQFLAALGIITILFVTLNRPGNTKNGFVACKENVLDTAVVASTDHASDAVSGKTFKGEKIRTFQGQRKLEQRSVRARPPNKEKEFPIMAKLCDKWAVVTTIFAPTDAVKAVASLSDWCLVIVGDTKTPANYLEAVGIIQEEENQKENVQVVYLSAEDQKKINVDFVQMLPFKSFSRKNVGFLFAVRHGAKVVFDFDDDNLLKSDEGGKPMSPFTHNLHDDQATMTLRSLTYNDKSTKKSSAFNPLPLMMPSTPDIVWPRGFPLQDLQDEMTTGVKNAKIVNGTIPISSVGVIQAVCDQDPDFDAIYRLTRPLPVTFGSRENLLVPLDLYTSYNAQATVHMYNAFWGMILPYTVHGRVADIWRSYFTQRIMHDLQLALVYAPPAVTHYRSAHDYLADFSVEQDLYLKTGALLAFLQNEWKDSSTWLPQRIENLCIALYERDYIQLEDVHAMQEWLLALLDIGYQFPELNNVKPLSPTTIMTDESGAR